MIPLLHYFYFILLNVRLLAMNELLKKHASNELDLYILIFLTDYPRNVYTSRINKEYSRIIHDGNSVLECIMFTIYKRI